MRYLYTLLHTHSAVQCSAVQYSIVHYRVQYSTVQHSTVQYNIVQHTAVQYIVAQYNAVQYNAAQYSTVHYSTMCAATPTMQSAQPLYHCCHLISLADCHCLNLLIPSILNPSNSSLLHALCVLTQLINIHRGNLSAREGTVGAELYLRPAKKRTGNICNRLIEYIFSY